jgi:predicted O-methyltransferase YrrM
MSQYLNLKQICSIYATDKNCLHCYVDEVYEELLKDFRCSANKVLEIGAYNGASIMMWKDYFTKAEIFTIDNVDCPQISGRERIHTLLGDAYSYETIKELPNNFDIIIEDGSHKIEDMSFVVVEYVKKLKPNGILVVEDIPDFNWTNILKNLVPDNYKVEIKDLRRVRGRYDDILMIIRA